LIRLAAADWPVSAGQTSGGSARRCRHESFSSARDIRFELRLAERRRWWAGSFSIAIWCFAFRASGGAVRIRAYAAAV
jgi:hypothetical protein